MEITIDTSKVRIETNRLVLRGFRGEDLHDFYDYAKIEGVGECAGWSHHKSIDESREILSKFIESKNVFAIVDKSNEKVIGSVGIKDPDEVTVSRLSGRQSEGNRLCSRKRLLGERYYDGSRKSRHLLLL